MAEPASPPDETAQKADAHADAAKALLQKGQIGDALGEAQAAIRLAPGHVDGLYIAAVCQRYGGDPAGALATLERLKASAPGYGRAHQEAGHVLRGLGRLDEAVGAYRQAVAANPALQASWRCLAEVLEAAGASDQAAPARAQAARLASLPPELVSVTSFIHEGKLLKAEQLVRAFLRKTPHHVEAMRLLADIGARLYVLDDAEFLLESCLEFAPDHVPARYDYVNVLHKRQKFAAALEEAKRLHDLDPDNPLFATALGNESMAVGDFEAALAIYDRVLAQLPDHPHTWLVKGHALKTVGRQDDAVSAYRKAYAVKPDFGDAFWSLANLKTYRFTEDEIGQMRAREAAPGIALADRYHLCFALGKALEDRREIDDAFTYYERGNALKKAELRYDADRMQASFDAQKQVCTHDLFKGRAGQGCPDPAPIFIVGLPRAGSTLLEQILASHSQVDGTFELPHILALAHRLNGRRQLSDAPRYPDVLTDLPAEDLERHGADYIRDTALYRQGAPFFTDKMPNNFRHIGLIHLILPNAKIIDARRHPLACCFSGFKQLFGEGQEFTYGLEEIGRYYRGYVDLMDHWDAVLPGKVLRVQYEEVVANLETQVRRLLDFCGLPFEPACLAFHETERSVRTASSEQVRQPIYDSGVEQWRAFEAHLDPLKHHLGPVLDRFA